MTRDGEAVADSWSTAVVALAGGVLLWLAFPPVGLVPLVWVAPLPWLWLMCRERLAGKQPYRQLYLAGFIQWLLLLQWVRLPHWSASFGWVALAAYLAIYLPLFIGGGRVLVHQRRWPIWIVAPVVWTGLELVRGYLFTGFAMLLLGHTLSPWPVMIQTADLAGAYAVSFLAMAVAGCIFSAFRDRTLSWRPLALAAVIVLGQISYGTWRIAREQERSAAGTATLDVMLVQGAIDTTFDELPEPIDSRKLYMALTRQALRKGKRPDLIIWPESMYAGFVEIEEPVHIPSEFASSPEAFRSQLQRWRQEQLKELRAFAQEVKTPAILGCGTFTFGPERLDRYNSAILVATDGSVVGHYRKMHPVMFGEYVPLGKWFPWLYHLTPMGDGLESGKGPVALEVQDVTLSPAICFENTVPQLIRRQVIQLQRQNQSPDALVTITNDGWFWGSSCLDVHLACAVFRSVEHHLPMLIAANTGFSASIDSAGRILKRGPRRAEQVLRAQVSALSTSVADTSVAGERASLTGYQRCGDVPAACCLLACLYAAIVGVLHRGARPGLSQEQ